MPGAAVLTRGREQPRLKNRFHIVGRQSLICIFPDGAALNQQLMKVSHNAINKKSYYQNTANLQKIFRFSILFRTFAPTMCTRTECIASLQAASPFIRSEFGVTSLTIFGSMARGNNRDGSDVDLCVEMPPKAFRVIALKYYLQDLLGCDVDLVRCNPNLDLLLTQEIARDGIPVLQ